MSFIQQSMVTYEFVSHCDCQYMGHTSLHLEELAKMFLNFCEDSNNQQKFYQNENVNSEL